MRENADLLIKINLSVFYTDDEAGFVTGDNPCFPCVPGDPPPFLGHPDVELTFPLTPNHLAFYSWKLPSLVYRKADRRMVDEANSRTIAGCRKEFISWKGLARNEWLSAPTGG